jgi:glycosyltransferase involved in cell wall biosynthesis
VEKGIKPKLSAFVLSFNEADNIEACLASIRDCVDDMYLVDSGSTDATAEIARRYGCTVIVNKFEGHSRQRNWALCNLPFQHPWVLALDADHRVLPELAEELRERFANPPEDVNGFFMRRRQIFRGAWIRHGGYYPKWQLKLFRHELTECDNEEFDYRYYVQGPTGKLRNDILEDNRKEWDITFWVAKHNKFARESAEEEALRRRRAISWRTRPEAFGNPDQRVLWLKEIWYRLPLYVRPFLYFFYRYFIKLGILDGKQGFIFHFMQGFWFRLLVDIHLEGLLAKQTRDVSAAEAPSPEAVR